MKEPASLLCAFRRGCCFRKLDSPEWTFILLLWKYLAAFPAWLPAPATWILWLLNCVWILPRTNSLANSPLLSFSYFKTVTISPSSCRPSLIPQFICHGSPLHDPVPRTPSPVLDAISSPQPFLPQIPSALWFSWLNKDCCKWFSSVWGVCIWVHPLGKMLGLWQLQFSYMTIIVFIFLETDETLISATLQTKEIFSLHSSKLF